LAGGVFWGVLLFIFTLVSAATGYGSRFLDLVAAVYPGFSVGYLEAFLGLLYGFVDGFVGFGVFAWLYNRMTALAERGHTDIE